MSRAVFAEAVLQISQSICMEDLHDFPDFWLVARRYVDRQGPSLVAEIEGPPTLKTATPVSCV